MIHLTNTVCIEAEKDAVWKVLAELENVHLWVEPILEAYCVGDDAYGVGTERICKLKGNITISERWIEWEEKVSFCYIAKGMPLVKSATNRWEIKEENGNTLVVSKAEIEFKGGIFEKLLSVLLKPAMIRLGPQSLAALKYWVENEEPYEGKYSTLPIAPVSC